MRQLLPYQPLVNETEVRPITADEKLPQSYSSVKKSVASGTRPPHPFRAPEVSGLDLRLEEFLRHSACANGLVLIEVGSPQALDSGL